MTLYALGTKYGTPPSAWCDAELSPLERLSLDRAALQVGLEAEERALREAQRKARRR